MQFCWYINVKINTDMFYYHTIFSHTPAPQFPISLQLLSVQLPVNVHVLKIIELYDYCANRSISASIFHILLNAIQKISAISATVCNSIHRFQAKSVPHMKLVLEMVPHIHFLLPNFIYIFPLSKKSHTHCSA